MKKKFLSLMMAAAVVATTSVSAFAAENDTNVDMPKESNINTLDSQDYNHEITITGKVQDNNGNMPTANFKVTVPTAANFTVNQAGNLVGPTLTVKNEGPQAISVWAQGFENTGTGSIKVISPTEIEQDAANGSGATIKRDNVSLRLEVDNKVVYLAAGNNKNGVASDKTLNVVDSGIELTTLPAGEKIESTKKIALKGIAGAKEIQQPVSDKFRLTLKIKKA